MVDQIASVIDDGRTPSTLITHLDLVRQVGNYAAHPVSDRSDPAIVLEVDAGEVEALFGALDEIFDVFYVKPARIKETTSRINKKLQSAGKPLLGEDPSRRADANRKRMA